VNQAIAQMDQVAQQHAALMQESAAASMQEQANALAATMAVFRADGPHSAGLQPAVGAA
jgi:methyl-accepting chemotaxis protein